MAREENYIEHALHVGEELTGLTLEQLGFEPRLEDLTEDQRSRLDPDDLELVDSITSERRDKSLFQAKLLAGALWEASAVLIDQLFEDLDGLRNLDTIDRQDIANTFVLPIPATAASSAGVAIPSATRVAPIWRSTPYSHFLVDEAQPDVPGNVPDDV
jgi:hypothetical protein